MTVELENVLPYLSERYVIDRIADGTITDLIEQLPEPYNGTVAAWAKSVEYALGIAVEFAKGIYHRAPHSGSRKEFAMWVMANHPNSSNILFAMYDDRSIVPQLLKILRENADTNPLISGVE